MTQVRITTRTYRQIAAWSGLTAVALLMASLLNAGVTTGSGVVQAAPTRMFSSPATAALADGDDVRFLANAPEENCELSAAKPLYAGLNTWVADPHWTCQFSSP